MDDGFAAEVGHPMSMMMIRSTSLAGQLVCVELTESGDGVRWLGRKLSESAYTGAAEQQGRQISPAAGLCVRILKLSPTTTVEIRDTNLSCLLVTRGDMVIMMASSRPEEVIAM